MATVKHLMLQLLRFSSSSFTSQVISRPWRIPLNCLQISRMLLYLSLQFKVQRLNIISRYIVPKNPAHALITQHYFRYLSRALSVRQRIACVITHFKFEEEIRSHAYQDAVYGGSGLELWKTEINGTIYKIVLVASDCRVEGELSVLLTCDQCALSLMSFAYVDKQSFGLGLGRSIVVTRNQMYNRGVRSEPFYHDFKQNFPPYFCLAAIYGIAQANNLPHILAVKAEYQVYYRGQSGFFNTYDEVWKSFNGIECDNVYLLKSEMDLKPVSTIKRCHRKRALARRENWTEIMVAARAILETTRCDSQLLPVAT